MDSKQKLKQMQRAAGIKAREALSCDEAEDFSRAVCERLAAHPLYENAAVILSYKPLKGEADVSFFNEQSVKDGKTVAYPVCRGNGIMVAAVPDSPDDADSFVKDRYGIDTPRESSSQILSPADIDLIIVPCVAFDGRMKMRIGMGGGYYDRFLPGCCNSKWIAAAFEAQHIEGIISQPWDVPMHAIITESACYNSYDVAKPGR